MATGVLYITIFGTVLSNLQFHTCSIEYLKFPLALGYCTWHSMCRSLPRQKTVTDGDTCIHVHCMCS